MMHIRANAPIADKIAQENTLAEANVTAERCGRLVDDIVFVTLCEQGMIDDTTATEHTNVFAEWASGVSYAVGNIRTYGEKLYKCVQAHTSQADWTPDVVPALWTRIGDPAEEWPEWSQPIGAHDAYQIGDKVSYNAKHWVSNTANNVWQPGVYGWDEST